MGIHALPRLECHAPSQNWPQPHTTPTHDIEMPHTLECHTLKIGMPYHPHKIGIHTPADWTATNPHEIGIHVPYKIGDVSLLKRYFRRARTRRFRFWDVLTLFLERHNSRYCWKNTFGWPTGHCKSPVTGLGKNLNLLKPGFRKPGLRNCTQTHTKIHFQNPNSNPSKPTQTSQTQTQT
jgi:hypothetical protein